MFNLLYTPIIISAFYIAKGLRFFFPKIKKQIESRDLDTIRSTFLSRESKPYIVFFCSSAGEFEQALPLIQLLEMQFSIHVFFFSSSGLDFAKKHPRTFSYSLSPIDTIASWKQLYDTLSPKFTVVIRHELWPNFLNTAARYGKVFLINITFSQTSKTGFSSYLRDKTKAALLYHHIDHFYCATDSDKKGLLDRFPSLSDKTSVTGDTKFDRVIQRKQAANLLAVDPLKKHLRQKVLLVGSGYKEDLEWILSAHKNINKDQWTVLFVPHILTDSYLAELSEQILDGNSSAILFSQITEGDHPDFLVFDKMGMLAELYSLANCAWVGGAIHNKVHNVLEPLAYNIPIAFGPNFINSREALQLVEIGAVYPCSDSKQLEKWWVSFDSSSVGEYNFKLDDYTGAAKAIYEKISAIAGTN